MMMLDQLASSILEWPADCRIERAMLPASFLPGYVMYEVVRMPTIVRLHRRLLTPIDEILGANTGQALIYIVDAAGKRDLGLLEELDRIVREKRRKL